MQVRMALTPNSLARRRPGVQIPSPPPPNTAGQSVASLEPVALTAFWGRAGAADAHGRVFDVGLGAAAELVDHQSNPSPDRAQRPARLAAHRPC